MATAPQRFDRLYPPSNARSIRSTDGHVDEFATFFAGLRSRWVKVERLQAYDESDFEGYRAFKDGDYITAKRLVREMVKSQTDVYAHARRFGVSMIRIRICDLPLSSYLRHYEIAAYEADIECGEDVRFVEATSISEVLAATGISDYVLFDDARVTALIYDTESGTMKDVLLTEDAGTVRSYVQLSDVLIDLSTPMLKSSIYQEANAVGDST